MACGRGVKMEQRRTRRASRANPSASFAAQLRGMAGARGDAAHQAQDAERVRPRCAKCLSCKWPGAESNCRHADFQVVSALGRCEALLGKALCCLVVLGVRRGTRWGCWVVCGRLGVDGPWMR